MAEDISHTEFAAKQMPALNHMKMLEAFRTVRELPNELQPHDLDSLLWKGLPLEIVRGGKFPELMDFSDFTDKLVVEASVLVKENNSRKNKKLPAKSFNYKLTRRDALQCNALLGGHGNAGESDLVEVCNSTSLSGAKVASGLRMALGTDSGLLGDVGGSLVNRARKSNVDLKIPALRAIMLLRQLTMLHGSEEGTYSLKARKLLAVAPRLEAGKALTYINEYDVVLDVYKLTDVQRDLINVLTSEWPSQKLSLNSDSSRSDIYSGIALRKDKRMFYVSQGPELKWETNGVQLTPSECWYEIVQLFRILGGLSDLIEVVSETRGFATIMNHMCSELSMSIHIGLPYARTRCYGSLKNAPVLQGHVRCTGLECSTMAMLVDNIMLSAALANIHFISEALGFLSPELNPQLVGTNVDRMNDVFGCYELKSRMTGGLCNDYITPWMLRLSRYGRLCSALISSHVNAARSGGIGALCGFYCHINSANKLTASSYQRLRDPIAISGIAGGVAARTDRQGEFMRLWNWARLVGLCKGTPISGPSILGITIGSEADELFNTFCSWEGDYKTVGYIVNVNYTVTTSPQYHLPDTFFYKSEYLLAVKGESDDGSLKAPRANSYSITPPKRSAGVAVRDHSATGNDIPSTQLDNSSTPNSDRQSSPGSSSDVSEPLAFRSAQLPDVEPEVIPYEVGNCGIASLKHLIPTLDEKAALGMLGCSLEDKFFLHGDELACIANANGKNVYVHHNTGPVDFYDNGCPDTIHLYQEGAHFQPMRMTGRERTKRVLKLDAVRVPKDESERQKLRAKIESGQTHKNQPSPPSNPK